jgi:predicted  nucleic acid-binding Zn-ribbon protein
MSKALEEAPSKAVQCLNREIWDLRQQIKLRQHDLEHARGQVEALEALIADREETIAAYQEAVESLEHAFFRPGPPKQNQR